MEKYRFSDDQYFVIEQYDQAKTFASFLPGIAGLYGIPIWSFFVNRGQAMASFGVKDKDHAIMEFYPANQAYQQVSKTGFRTFIKVFGDKGSSIFEPFSPYRTVNGNPARTMYIKENELKIEEVNDTFGVKTTVTYFTLPNERFGALVRHVQIENISGGKLALEVLDGIPAVIPYGITNSAYKEVGNTLKSWMDVDNRDHHIPFYKVRSSTGDTAEVEEITNGHFYLSFGEDGKLIDPIVDISLIFGEESSLTFPDAFADQSVDEMKQTEPVTSNKVPCGFSGLSVSLEPGAKKKFYTLVGHAKDIETVNEKANEIADFDYMNGKYEANGTLVTDLTRDVSTRTGSSLFDAYTKQSYLDNLLRGGYPVSLSKGPDDSFIYYVYSRKHGDLERDYNFFSVAPEYFSQGNGNFRDVNQNRRNDIFFHPETGDHNIKLFMNLIQPDGYNPLVVKGSRFVLSKPGETGWVREIFNNEADAFAIEQKLASSYTPGDLFQTILDEKMPMAVSLPEFLQETLARSTQQIEAEFGEGYWIDHWTYNLDLIENYLKVYPDNKEHLLFEDNSYMYFSSRAFVNPRSEKAVLADGKVRQYGSVSENHSQSGPQWVMTKDGETYTTNLFSKLFSLALIKFSTLDPFGMGIEMEANKPGWNDSMNGLPGMFGSAMSETLELKRLLKFIIKQKDSPQKQIQLPVEVAALLDGVMDALAEFNNNGLTQFDYWDKTSTIREAYRYEVKEGFSGSERSVDLHELTSIAETLLEKVAEGIEQAKQHGDGLIPTYFSYEAADWEKVLDDSGEGKRNAGGYPVVKVNSFNVAVLPHFLEGPAREMKSEQGKTAAAIYRSVKESEIYDDRLNMYKTSASLESQSIEIGRARAFTPGWLERESVFMHMEFKYLLGMLKAGLYDEFFEDLAHALPPFLDPGSYGRSPLENSSFIASSVNPDPTVHGRGFVARLSGTTSEFLSMWVTMMAGKELFKLENGSLTLELQPILPGWLFDESGRVEFQLLGTIPVTYHNPSGKHTFGDDGVKPDQFVIHFEDGKTVTEHDKIREPYSLAIRDGKAKKIDVYLK
ncbi:cellobiose phosphorylase [Bacillus marinisedimentorum]|uniref:cellobiose phosphorylase n=1 Tax=Bacillus marinisedimentorum TaxID=1821260 RepID=UPI0007E19537|nr:cellobiose phosphorylase [Bacillus marinisedimentorum]